MPTQIQWRRGNTAQTSTFTGAVAEITVDTSKNTLVVHDGVTTGGWPVPQLSFVQNSYNTANTAQATAQSAFNTANTDVTNITITSGTFGNNTTIPSITVGANGRITAISSVSLNVAVDLSAIMEDVTPAINGVYDIGTEGFSWYNGYFINSLVINNTSLTGSEDGTISVNANTILTSADITAESILFNDLFITDNMIKPLLTPLYGLREVIVDGGLHVASEDPAYIRLSQEIPVTEKTVSQRFSNVEDGYAFPWQTSSGGSDSFMFFMDVSQLASGFPQEMWVYSSNNGAYTQILAGQLTPGVKYKIEAELIASYFAPYAGFYTTRTVLESYLFEEVEYVGSEVFAGNLYLKFKSPTPGSSAIIGGTYNYPGYGFNGAGLDFVISAESTTIEYDYSVLDTYGSEGMIRFNPETKKFEGHNGTAWDSVTAVDPATVFVNTSLFGVTTSLTANESDTGLFNNFLGYQAGYANTSGQYNNFFGYQAGFKNTTGTSNNFFGRCAGFANTTGGCNNFFGSTAGKCNTTGRHNNFFGSYAGFNNTTGECNNFFGFCAGYSNTTGSRNNFFGLSAGQSNTTGTYNNFFGNDAGRYNTTGCHNNFFGSTAGNNNASGNNNNFFGYQAGFSNCGGYNNNFFGYQAGISNCGGSNNNFMGYFAGCKNTTGACNNFFGYQAGFKNTTGTSNNFFGQWAGICNTIGSNNNFFGSGAGYSNTTGGCNNFFGNDAGLNNTTGNHNLFLGSSAGEHSNSGSNNLFFGCASATAAGLECISTQSNRIIMGNNAHTCAQIQVAWTVVSDCRDKCIFGSVPHGRGFLQNLETIEYAFKDRTTGCVTDPEGKRRYGFSAQNILEQEGDDPVIVSTENQDKLQVTHDYLIPILVNAIKELSQEVDNIINENKTLKDRILNLEQK